MNILMMTNTYKPIVGGLERSVESFSEGYRARGHNVIIAAPRIDGDGSPEEGVVRVPAIQHFNGTDFAIKLPIPGVLSKHLKDFTPDIVHSHHPFLIGDTALRVAAEYNVPMVFTFHTLYEKYTHYVPVDSPSLQRFVIALSTGYCNLCDRVFAPSEGVADMLRERGVTAGIEVVPTGIRPADLSGGDRAGTRERLDIPAEAFVVGYTGRVASEKNMEFLAGAAGEFLEKNRNAYFLVVGDGPALNDVRKSLDRMGVEDRIRLPGTLKGGELAGAYAAIDVFAFSSETETQGLVITEAMAASLPVVALDATGVGEVVADGVNGCLVTKRDRAAFEAALEWIYSLDEDKMKTIKKNARETAEKFSIDSQVEKALSIYASLTGRGHRAGTIKVKDSPWAKAALKIKTELDLLSNLTKATKEGFDKER